MEKLLRFDQNRVVRHNLPDIAEGKMIKVSFPLVTPQHFQFNGNRQTFLNNCIKAIAVMLS